MLYVTLERMSALTTMDVFNACNRICEGLSFLYGLGKCLWSFWSLNSGAWLRYSTTARFWVWFLWFWEWFLSQTAGLTGAHFCSRFSGCNSWGPPQKSLAAFSPGEGLILVDLKSNFCAPGDYIHLLAGQPNTAFSGMLTAFPPWKLSVGGSFSIDLISYFCALGDWTQKVAKQHRFCVGMFVWWKAHSVGWFIWQMCARSTEFEGVAVFATRKCCGFPSRILVFWCLQ